MLGWLVDRQWNQLLQKWENGENRMTYDGMKNARYENFGFYVSEFLEIYAKNNQGGFLKRFVMGLIKAFLTLIDTIVGFFVTLPVIKQVVEIILSAIVKVFGLTYNEAEGLLKSILKTLLISILIFFAPTLVGTTPGTWGASSVGTMLGASSGYNLMPTLTMTFDMYSAGMIGIKEGAMKDEESEQEIANQLNEEFEDPISQAFSGTMGATSTKNEADDMMYNLMFNPLDMLTFGELPATK